MCCTIVNHKVIQKGDATSTDGGILEGCYVESQYVAILLLLVHLSYQ
ncbi:MULTISPECIES: hypothetical protein [Providencia]|nr:MULTISPECIES: hypothetical protein [Providencia]